MKKTLSALLLGALLASVTLSPVASGAAKVKVGMAYDIGGPGDKSFNDAAFAGLLRAKKALGVTSKEVSATLGTQTERESKLRYLISEGCNPIIAVGYRYSDALKKIATDNPDISFAIIDNATIDLLNVAALVFSTNESAYLAGVAAALASVSAKIGFIGVSDPPPFDTTESGFIAGVKATNSKANVLVKYISNPPTFSGYNDPSEAKGLAQAMIASKVDVIYSAADGSGAGTFSAAAGKKVWTIGSDFDQYLTASTAEKKNMLTSTVKHVDLAIYDFIDTAVHGSTVNDVLDSKLGIYGRLYTLQMGGVELSTSGGYINKYKAQLNAAKKALTSGKISVPMDGTIK